MEGFEYPHGYTQEWKEYSEDGQIYRQHRVTGEKIWIDRDWTYKHQKGGKGKKGKEEEEKKKKKAAAPKEGEASAGFVFRDEEDRKYWEEMDKQSEEQKKKEAEELKKKEEEGT